MRQITSWSDMLNTPQGAFPDWFRNESLKQSGNKNVVALFLEFLDISENIHNLFSSI